MYAWVTQFVTSTVGSKFLVAITGLGLTGFVIAHMAGNLQIFLGADAINEYAKKLKDMGPLLWLGRLALLAIFVLHIGLAVRLKLNATAARPIGYAHPNNVQATWASRTMVWTGLLVLVFVVFHIAHYTLGLVQSPGVLADIDTAPRSLLDLRDSHGHHDVYRMMIIGFKNPIISVLYIIAQIVLALHLSHGVGSTFQTLGLNTPRTQSMFRILGWLVTLIVCGGNIAIVAAVWAGALK